MAQLRDSTDFILLRPSDNLVLLHLISSKLLMSSYRPLQSRWKWITQPQMHQQNNVFIQVFPVARLRSNTLFSLFDLHFDNNEQILDNSPPSLTIVYNTEFIVNWGNDDSFKRCESYNRRVDYSNRSR
ncbi:uncharacterized protein PHALS_15015 [Plasmopara halstedii]|uniref:Uncharacterized protein n=1 Tax=Plasmopara halstedii TaxID=4781 RepID=A0A0P1A8S3_PLAHL|nr:uncharacterized protein PHALS_15015 [Plasmopara halstedii]CEG37061.1 hypothetical protein PHALS_15015 [Plasmopara halstedii]|eukprot:XP_024573430.1 hypothetical protein PHALS_15015 [Plasmopara halstedii]